MTPIAEIDPRFGRPDGTQTGRPQGDDTGLLLAVLTVAAVAAFEAIKGLPVAAALPW